MMKRALTVFLIVLCVCSTSHALTVNGGATSTYIFNMLVNADGTVIDDGTLVIDGRFKKTEVKNALTPFTAGIPISYGDISIYRIQALPLTNGDSYDDSIWMVYFDETNYSTYIYRYKDKIEKEDE